MNDWSFVKQVVITFGCANGRVMWKHAPALWIPEEMNEWQFDLMFLLHAMSPGIESGRMRLKSE